MRVLITGGGTAGHINPALAIAQCIRKKEPRAKLLYAGTPFGMEADLVPKAGFDFVPIKVKGFQRKLNLENIKRNIQALSYLAAAGGRARKILRDFNPDIVIGTGGYVSGPVVRTASKMGIKTAIHEQNAFPGVTNKLLAKKADIVFVAVEEAKKAFDAKCNTVTVGNPIRENIILQDRKSARKKLGVSENSFCILSFGGSLGARIINIMAADLIRWHYKNKEIHHIHATGKSGQDSFPKLLAERSVRLKDPNSITVNTYIDNMDLCLAAADLAICRSGAITLSELEAAGKASILVPSPYVAENHQYHNAMVLVKHNAALMVQEKDYQKEKLVSMVNSLYNDRKKVEMLAKNASKLAIIDTTERIYNEIKLLLKSNFSPQH